jgi:photosystem II Psb27 protein
MSFEPPISIRGALNARGGTKASGPAVNPLRSPSRRTVLATIGVAALPAVALQPALADEPITGYKLKKDYPADARQMLDAMKIATDMTRGTPNMEAIVKNTRSEMNDFVAFYRRQPKVAGMPSFSTMYTAVNTLSGHYASYGNKYPVPKKRQERLQQQYKEIDRALARGK